MYKSWNIEPMTFSPKRHKGFLGLMKLRRAIRNRKFTDIADVHDVLRSKILRANLLGGPKVAHIDKGRAEKQRMIKTKDVAVPLMPTTERYKSI